MRLAMAPINPTVGDLSGNAERIARAIDGARAVGADCALLPEMAVSGYPPRDLLLQEGFVEACMERARALAGGARGLTALVGCPWRIAEGPSKGAVANSLLVLRDGRVEARYDKRLLPTYDVFDEDRYFAAGDHAMVVDIAGEPAGLSVCEDLWRGADAGALERYARSPDPVAELVRAGASVILNPSASPFVLGKSGVQQRLLARHAGERGVTIAAVNQFGANDDLIFDGRASVYISAPDAPGGARLVGANQPLLGETLVVDLPADPVERRRLPAVADPLDSTDPEELLWRALTLGVRDYCRKCGFSSVVLGVSGGIDSAVTACVAAAAIGPERVLGLRMPGRHSSEGSLSDAAALGAALGVRLVDAPIGSLHDAATSTLAPGFGAIGLDAAPGVTDENVQSRLRGLLVMAYSNKTGALPLTTGNKSELAVGYCTLYGDMNGGLAVLSDVTKAWVYRLARWLNANHARAGFSTPPVPVSTIEKPPSAELRPNQTDQDSLPPYDLVDEVVERYVERKQAPARVARELGVDPAVVQRLVRLIDTSEFKRRQAAVGLKVTSVAFGAGRRQPIAQGWRPGAGV